MNTDELGILVAILCIIGFVVATIAFSVSAMTTGEVDIHVVEKVGAHGSNGNYMIFDDNEVFIVEDNWFKLKYDASDRWRVMKVNSSYHCTVTGMRFQPLSMYRNLIECEEI